MKRREIWKKVNPEMKILKLKRRDVPNWGFCLGMMSVTNTDHTQVFPLFSPSSSCPFKSIESFQIPHKILNSHLISLLLHQNFCWRLLGSINFTLKRSAPWDPSLILFLSFKWICWFRNFDSRVLIWYSSAARLDSKLSV